MTKMNWAFEPSVRLAQAVRDREISAADLLAFFLDRVARFNPEINAVVVLDAERARSRAMEADKALARGEVWGPLHGVPMTVKDSFDVAGLPTTWGVPAMKDNIASTNATAVQSLIDAGAVIFGKTNIPFMISDWQSFNAIYGTTNNPWDLTRGPGGSSGGAAAAVAAGLTALEVGSDIGSSIRNPAHYCGVYGHKPSFGIVPQAGHSIPVARTPLDLLVCGPLARSAEDLALAMDLLAAPEPNEAPAWSIQLPAPRKGSLRDYRVAVLLDSPDCKVDTTVIEVLKRRIDELRAAGVTVDERARPAIDLSAAHALFIKLLRGATGALLDADAYAAIEKDAADYPKNDRSYRARVAHAGMQSHREWFAGHEERHRIRDAWAAFFRDYDLLLCPVAATAAFPHDQEKPRHDRSLIVNNQLESYNDQLFWAGLATLPYLPATVAPAGLTTAGLPVGLQIIGPYLHDRTTIEFARLMGQATGGFVAPPRYA
jgi:amidase